MPPVTKEPRAKTALSSSFSQLPLIRPNPALPCKETAEIVSPPSLFGKFAHQRNAKKKKKKQHETGGPQTTPTAKAHRLP
jgi:hypothetical protein